MGSGPGVRVEVRCLKRHSVQRLLIPLEAVRFEGQTAQVAVVGVRGTIHLQRGEVGASAGGKIDIASGLLPGGRLLNPLRDTIREGDRAEN